MGGVKSREGTCVVHGKRGPGVGDLYRVTAVGPGVTPDLVWQAPALHAYSAGNPADVTLEDAMNTKLDQMRAGWHKCLHH